MVTPGIDLLTRALFLFPLLIGLTSQETLIVQRVDQAGTLTQGHGVCK